MSTSNAAIRRPIVLIPSDVKRIGEHPFHGVGQKYILAVAEAAGATPLLVPAISNFLDLEALLALADGVMLTGSYSNVHPSHFGQEVLDPSLPLDPARDTLTLPLIHSTIAAGLPLLAICRGFQELNVAYGGSLHQAVQNVAGKNDHREIKDMPLDAQYAQVHEVNLTQNGKLAKLLGKHQLHVNSLHGQGIDRLGKGLVAEAHAPDGLIEAISVADSKAFAIGVQWHPEWKVTENPDYLAIFNAFGNACRTRLKLTKI